MKTASAAAAICIPDELPICGARADIIAALDSSQVVIVCGATGSGKTTQLPKICLAAGRGVGGMIGHTQPRRIAAVAVAKRIATELGGPAGAQVGYQVRFDQQLGAGTRIKLMTDGILLNEIRADRNLAAYDTLIIDEAHERTVNIDFLLGYLKLLLRRRRDLRVIVTSATVDVAAFSDYFDGAPVIDVEGRSYPVAIEYRPSDEDEDLSVAISAVCRDLAGRPLPDDKRAMRDILVFLPGERFIRDAEAELQRTGPTDHEVLPLYARLGARRQQRVFQPADSARIILATNIAETSLTVPRIRYVVDTGLARIKRYSTRHRIDTLRVEPIAQANARQRAGRCGRLAPGICVRLWAESDFDSRPEFTDPEILRTNLAGALLRLKTLGLGSLKQFPFLDEPSDRYVNDAERLLHVLGATDEDGRLTNAGRIMARLPVDPRLGRLLLAGREQRCLREASIVAAALGAADPRESPTAMDDATLARQQRFTDPSSEFSTFVNLWSRYDAVRRKGRAAVRSFCEEFGLAANRLQEWGDLHEQLISVTKNLGWRSSRQAAPYAVLHKAVMSAFVDYVAERDSDGSYRGMHGVRSRLRPGSPVAKRKPRWVMAAEHVATERNYLRIVARANPRWIEQVAPHLVKRTLGAPRWDEKRGIVAARETSSAFGLVLRSDRWADYGAVDPAGARTIFVEAGLAVDRLGAQAPFATHNRELKERLLGYEARQRSRDLFVGDIGLARFYQDKLPADVLSRKGLLEWCRTPANEKRLHARLTDLATRPLPADFDDEFPLKLCCAGHPLDLEYRFVPGDDTDGVTLRLPAVLIDSLLLERPDWLVPGYLAEKVLALLRTLPKEQRRPLVPLPDTVAAILPALRHRFGVGLLPNAIVEALEAQGLPGVDSAALDDSRLPLHLRMRVELVGGEGETIAVDRDFRKLRRGHGGTDAARTLAVARANPYGRKVYSHWTFGDLPDRVDVATHGTTLALYPAVSASGRGVRIELLPPGPGSAERHRQGLGRLLVLAMPQQAALLRDSVRGDKSLVLLYHGLGTSADLAEEAVMAAAEAAFQPHASIRTEAQFKSVLCSGRERFVRCGELSIELLREILPLYRSVRSEIDATVRGAPDAADDMKAQLDRLVYPGFLSATPAEWLARMPRYLQAMLKRCEALRYRNHRDPTHRALVDAAEQRLKVLEGSLPPGWPLPEPAVRYRWLVEELRVSLFAQGLGTSVPASARRLEKFWYESVETE